MPAEGEAQVAAGARRAGLADDQSCDARLVEQPARFAEYAVGRATGDLQRAAQTRCGAHGRRGTVNEMAGQEKQDAVGTVEPGLVKRGAHRLLDEVSGRLGAAEQGTGCCHALLPGKRQRSATTQRAHSGLRALHT